MQQEESKTEKNQMKSKIPSLEIDYESHFFSIVPFYLVLHNHVTTMTSSPTAAAQLKSSLAGVLTPGTSELNGEGSANKKGTTPSGE